MLLQETYPAQPASLRRIRHATQDAVRRAGGDEELQDAVALGVSEAATNAVRHGYADDAAGTIHLAVRLAGAGLEVIVCDDGVGIRPRRDDTPSLGYGLSLMAAMADTLNISRGPDGNGTRVTMGFALTTAPA